MKALKHTVIICFKAYYAIPNYWSAGNGTVGFTVRDQGSGLASVVLQRYSAVTNSWSTVRSWTYNGTTSSQSGTYTESLEGVFYYKLTIKDKVGNTTTKTSSYIYLDHSNPIISGAENTVTDWTNVAPVIRVSATDYFSGTSYTGSGLSSLVIRDDTGRIVASGTTSTTLTVNECSEFHSLGESHENIRTVDEAIHIWKKIPAERLRGIKAIGIRVEDKQKPNDYEEMDVLIGRRMDLEMLHYYPDIMENEKAVDMIRELRRKLPNLEVMGEIPESKEHINIPRKHR